MKNLHTFEEFLNENLNEAYSASDKKALINSIKKSISDTTLNGHMKGTIIGCEIESDDSIRLTTEFEDVVLKIVKIEQK